MVQIQAYSQLLIKRRREKENELALARQAVRLNWDQLVQARQQREVVDHFLERQKTRYRFECQREEQKLLDELACHYPDNALTSPLTMNPPLPS
jgi:flagellar export protein FliJ